MFAHVIFVFFTLGWTAREEESEETGHRDGLLHVEIVLQVIFQLTYLRARIVLP